MYLLNQLDRYLLGIVSKPIEQDLHFGDGQGGGLEYQLIAGPAFTLAYTAAGLPLSWIADRTGKAKEILVLCLLVWSSCTALSGLTTAYWQLFLLRLGTGFGEAGCTPLAAGIIAAWFEPSVRGAALGVYKWGIYIGYGLAFTLGTYVAEDLGWRGVFLSAGLPGVAVALLFAVTVRAAPRVHVASRSDSRASQATALSTRSSLVPGTPGLRESVRASAASVAWAEVEGEGEGRVRGLSEVIGPGPALDVENGGRDSCSGRGPDAGADGGDRTDTAAVGVKDTLLFFFRCKSLLLLCVGGALRNAAGSTWALNTQPYFVIYRHLHAVQVGQWMSWVPVVGGSAGALWGGYLSDKIVRTRGPNARVWVLTLSQLVAAPFCALAVLLPTAPNDPSPWPFLSLIPAYIVGEMWIGTAIAVVLDLVPKEMTGTAVAMYMFVIANVGGNANVLVSALLEVLDYKYTLLVMYPGLTVASGLLFFLLLLFMRYGLRRDAVKQDTKRCGRQSELVVRPSDESGVEASQGTGPALELLKAPLLESAQASTR